MVQDSSAPDRRILHVERIVLVREPCRPQVWVVLAAIGADGLAQIARDLVAVMRRDIRTDWTVRDDVRAKLRSSIKRLLAIHKYPPDQQPAAIKLVMEQMESMAPRYAPRREAS